MHWILQNNIFNEDAYDYLIETLHRFGIPHSIHKVVPFVGNLIPEPESQNGSRLMRSSSTSLIPMKE